MSNERGLLGAGALVALLACSTLGACGSDGGGAGGGGSSGANLPGGDGGAGTDAGASADAGPAGRAEVAWVSLIQGDGVEHISGMAGCEGGVIAWGSHSHEVRFNKDRPGETTLTAPSTAQGGAAFVGRWTSDGSLSWLLPLTTDTAPSVAVRRATVNGDCSVVAEGTFTDLSVATGNTMQLSAGTGAGVKTLAIAKPASSLAMFELGIDANGAPGDITELPILPTVTTFVSKGRRFTFANAAVVELDTSFAKLWETPLTNGVGTLGVSEGFVDESGNIALVGRWYDISAGSGNVVFAPGTSVAQPQVTYGADNFLVFRLSATGTVTGVRRLAMSGASGNVLGSALPGGALTVLGPGGAGTGSGASLVRDEGAEKVAWTYRFAEGKPQGGISSFAGGATLLGLAVGPTGSATPAIGGEFWKILADGKLGWMLACPGVVPRATAVASDGTPFVAGTYESGSACGTGAAGTFPPTQSAALSDAFIARLSDLPL